MASTTRQNSDLECPKCAGRFHIVKLASMGPKDTKFIEILQCSTCKWYMKI